MNGMIIITLATVFFVANLSLSEAGDVTNYDDCNACTDHGMGCESKVMRVCTQKYELPNGEVKYVCEGYVTKYICSKPAHKELPIPDVQAADFKAVADETTYYDDCKPCESSGLGCKSEVRHICLKKNDLPNGAVECTSDKDVTKYICIEPDTLPKAADLKAELPEALAAKAKAAKASAERAAAAKVAAEKAAEKARTAQATADKAADAKEAAHKKAAEKAAKAESAAEKAAAKTAAARRAANKATDAHKSAAEKAAVAEEAAEKADAKKAALLNHLAPKLVPQELL